MSAADFLRSNRRRWLVVGCAAGVILGSWLWWQSVIEKPVHLLLVTLDTTRADRLGCYGYEDAETPYLDALARRGVMFERAYATAPMTAPSHASMFTGLLPPEHGVYTNGLIALDAGIPSVTEALRRHGYETAAFVAAFVLQAKFGLNRGFVRYDDDLSTAAPGGDLLHSSRDGRLVVDAAIQWLERRRQQKASAPFFCWVHLYDPHDPYLPHAEEFGDKFRDRPYDGEIAYIDIQLARLSAALERIGALENTVVIVVGDHGESLGEHGEINHGYMLHESTLRVPLIIADPRRKSAARRVSTPVSLIDLYPSLLELGGLRPDADIRARSLLPAMKGAELAPRICYSQTEEPYLQSFWSPLRGVTTQRWRYVRTTKPELYDLEADPRELVNLAAQLPDQVSELDGELAAQEATFKQHKGARLALSDSERRALEGLGYAGGGGQADSGAERELPDIKDMIGYHNQLQEGIELIESGKFDEAAALIEPVARAVPNFARAPQNLGLCRLRQGRYEDAVRWLKQALEADPNADRVHDMLGFAYLKLRRLDLAEHHLRRLLELQPDSERGHLYLGEVYQRQEKYPLAMREYELTLRINPRNQAAREALGALASRLRSP